MPDLQKALQRLNNAFSDLEDALYQAGKASAEINEAIEDLEELFKKNLDMVKDMESAPWYEKYIQEIEVTRLTN